MDLKFPCSWMLLRIYKLIKVAILAGLFGFICIATRSYADIATDGTTGPLKTLSGPDYLIPQNLGSTVGGNLFHSFERFSVMQGESATFTGGDAVANVISRVSGGAASSIDGLLRSEVGQADFFFINPAGVVFGPNAEVDVPAAFHVSVADELWFVDGGVFSAAEPEKSSLSVAEPASFGYLNSQPASVVLNGSRLTFAPGSEVSLDGGDVTMQEGASMVCEGGDIRINAKGKSESIAEFGDGEQNTAFTGNVHISQNSTIDVSGSKGAEKVILKGGLVEIANSVVAADHRGGKDADGRISISGDSVRVIDSDVHAHVFGAGKGNDITVESRKLEINGATAPDGISRLTARVMEDASGKAGDIDIKVDSLSLLNGGNISSLPEKLAAGSGGKIHITASDDVLIDGYNDAGRYSGIYSMSYSEIGASGGSVLIEAPEALITINEGVVQTVAAGNGDAGSVTIDAKELQVMNEGAIWTFSNGDGEGGDVSISVKDRVSIDSGEIDSSNYGVGDSGRISLIAGELGLLNAEIVLEASGFGKAGEIYISTRKSMVLDDGSLIEAGTGGSGTAGNVQLSSYDISLLGKSMIFAGTIDKGHGGFITIEAINSLLIDNYSFISSGSLGGGSAGKISIKAKKMQILNGGGVINKSFHSGDSGDSGDTVIEASNVVINGHGEMTGVFNDLEAGTGQGGDIRMVLSGRLELLDGGQISSNTSGVGNAGKVLVSAEELLIDGRGEAQSQFCGIYSKAGYLSSGNGGDVNVNISGKLQILNGGQISTSSTGGKGIAGDVIVEAKDIVINDSNPGSLTTGILSRCMNGEKSTAAGVVLVKAKNRMEIFDGGTISATAAFGKGKAGMVVVNAKEIVINGGNQDQITGISSELLANSSDAGGEIGRVEVNVMDRLEIFNGGKISTSSTRSGDAGTVMVEAKKIIIDGKNKDKQSGIVSIVTYAGDDGVGNAGDIRLAVRESLVIRNGGEISTNSNYQGGDAGSITVETSQLLIDGEDSEIVSESMTGSAGKGGKINLIVEELLFISNKAMISTTTLTDKKAGNVTIDAGHLRIDNGGGIFCTTYGAGQAGQLSIRVDNIMDISNGGTIDSDTISSGDAGNVTIEAETILLNSSGNISSSTCADGDAGSILISADELLINGERGENLTRVASLSTESSKGLVGNVKISTDTLTIRKGGEISIEGKQTLPDERLEKTGEKHIFIVSDSVMLDQAGINAASAGNTPAASVRLKTKKLWITDNSRITTSSKNADGGSITVSGEKIILRNGLITTSVDGLKGDGGDIMIDGVSSNPVDALIFDGGFIQANTAAEGARGGDIIIDAQTVIAESGLLEVGGSKRKTFKANSGVNVIQAAAPGGEQGSIAITAPNLDISGSLISIAAGFAELIQLATDPCRTAGSKMPGKLVPCGKGGIPKSVYYPAAVSWEVDRIGKIIKTDSKMESIKKK